MGAVQNTKEAESDQQSETETQNSIRTTSEQDADSIINSAMSMDQCRDMVQRAFILAGIKEWYDGEYKNGDEWLKGAGVDEVAMYIENEYTLQEKYLNKIPALMSGDIALEEILDAYLNGSLLGTVSKPKAQRLDVTRDTNYRDSRFYAPQNYDNENVMALYQTANQNALRQLAWSNAQLKILEEQMQHTRGFPEIAGGYSTTRHLTNAVRRVINTKEDPRETLLNYARTINEEIRIKRREFNLPLD